MSGPLISVNDLDRRLIIMRAATTDDGFATVAGEPAEIGRRWVGKRDISDRERLLASQQGAEVTTRFVMRWDALTSTITAADTLVCEGMAYEIVGKPKELGRREGIEITATSR